MLTEFKFMIPLSLYSYRWISPSFDPPCMYNKKIMKGKERRDTGCKLKFSYDVFKKANKLTFVNRKKH